MAGCGSGRVIAHPASAGFCSPQVKLTTPSREMGFDLANSLHPARYRDNACAPRNQ
jgi:hypothetical protein